MKSKYSGREISLGQFKEAHSTPCDHAILVCCEQKFLKWLEDMKLPDELADSLTSLYIPLVNLLRKEQFLQAGHTPVIGISGSQGSGKSTFTSLLAGLLREAYHYKVVSFSIDDFYHTREYREKLSRDIHPLLKTRGVPGTHDVGLALSTIENLLNGGSRTETFIPVFDKSVDDRKSREEWVVYKGRPDVILFEGWCVGAVPQDEQSLSISVNDLERQFDQEGRFRSYVNRQLSESYSIWFSKIDFLIMLSVPSFDHVYDWRLLQEKKLAEQVYGSGSKQKNLRIMSEDEVKYFISHYERITRHMLKEMPERADLVVRIGEDHQYKSIRHNKPSRKA